MKNIFLTIIVCMYTGLSFGAALEMLESGDFQLASETVSSEELFQDYAKLKQKNIVSSGRTKGFKLTVYGDRTIAKDELDEFIYSNFASNGVYVVFESESNSLSLINAKEMRYAVHKQYHDINKVPKESRFVKFFYRLKHADPKSVERSFRPFQSRSGRIYSVVSSNTIVVQDTGTNIHRLYSIIKTFDTPETAKDIEWLKKFNSDLKDTATPKESMWDRVGTNGLFVVLFSLIFLVIGFLLRGYMIKRIEGGL